LASALFALPLLLSACGAREQRPPPRPVGSRPVTLNIPTSRETQACFADLSRKEVRYSPLPDRDYGGGCQVIGAVQLIDIGVPVTNLKGMRCGLAGGSWLGLCMAAMVSREIDRRTSLTRRS